MGRKRKLKEIIKDTTKLIDRVDECVIADEKKTSDIIQDIKNVMYNDESIVALSAPQIGYKSRVFCIRFANGDIRTFINPMITHREGMHLSRETCVSIEGKEYLVTRANDIQVKFQTPMGNIEDNLFQGTPSEVFQQMCEILDGVLISDYGLEIIDGWDEASEEERQQVIDMYFKHLEEVKNELQEEINNDADLKEINDAIDFMTKVATGEVQVEQEEQHILNREQRRLVKKLDKYVSKLGKEK